MKKRIRALKAMILAFIMVLELFGVDSLRALAAEIMIDSTTIIEAEYYLSNDDTLVVNSGVTVPATTQIYGSGGTIKNSGTIKQVGNETNQPSGFTIENYAGGTITNLVSVYSTVTNKGTIGTYSSNGYETITNEGSIGSFEMWGNGTLTNTGTMTTCVLYGNGASVTNDGAGSINLLSLESGTTLTLKGGTITNLESSGTLSGCPTINVEGTATVSNISGVYEISGTGTILVTGTLNLEGDYSDPSCTIEVADTTNITVGTGSQVKVTYGAKTYLLSEGEAGTLAELAGQSVSATLADADGATMTEVTPFSTDKFLPGKTATATYTAKSGYYFPSNYSASVSPASPQPGTATVSRSADGQSITVTFTFAGGDDAVVTLPAATAKTTPAAPTGLVGGVKKVSNVPTDKELEYADSETATTWTTVTGLDDADTITMEPGTWYFRYKETNETNASAATSVVVKDEGTAEINISDVYYGTDPNPVATSSTNIGQTPTFEYKEATQDDTAYSTTVPTAVGDYIVRATFPATEEYGEAVATKTFAIKYLEAPATAYTLVGTAGENGYYTSSVTVKPATGYTISATLDGTYTETLTVDASQAAGTIYLKNAAGAKTDGITLEAIKIDASAPILNVSDGSTYKVATKEIEIIDSNLSSVTINGTAQTVSGTTFTKTLAESETAYVIVAEDEAGNSATATIYVLRDAQSAPTGLEGGIEQVKGVSINMEYAASADTDTWTAVTGDLSTGTIAMAKGTWYFRYQETDVLQASPATSVTVKGAGRGTVTMNDVYYGVEVNPQVQSDTNDVADVTIEYKEVAQDDTEYSTIVPTAIGEYIVRATFPETEEYGEAVATDTFAIKYLETPSPAYSLEGTAGQNGYYKSAVTVKPATGYTISKTLGGTYETELTVNASQAAGTIYLKNADGAMTDGIALEAINIDDGVPEINVVDGETYSVTTQPLTVKDSNLSKVTINGIDQSFTGTTFTTDLAESETAYEIVAEDIAGNKTTVTVTVLRVAQTAPTGLEGGVLSVSGVTDAMEYAASATAATWTAVTGISATNTISMTKGDWYFRYKETDDKKASPTTLVTVKGEGLAEININDVYYGIAPNPTATSSTNSGQTPTFEYKKAAQADTAYSATKPTAVGDYIVRATFPATAEYGEAVATDTFAIKYLETPSPAYSLEGTAGENGYYTSAVTVKPATGYTISKILGGTYETELTVAVSQAVSTIYLKNADGAMTDGIALEAIKIDASAPELNVKDGKTYSVKTQPLTVSDSGLRKVTINGVAQTVSGTTFTTSLAVSDTAYVIVAEDVAGNTVTATIRVEKPALKIPTGSIEVRDVYYGTLPEVKVISDSNNVSRAVIEYKFQGSSDATYTTSIPAKVGNYVVRATVPANDEYESLVVTSSFSIRYLPAPDVAYALSGVKGDNGYYTSNVTVTPAKGYLIATKLDGTYQESLSFTENTDGSVIYLKNAATGEKTDAVSLEAIKIKKEVPTLNLEDGVTYYGDTAKLVIRDMCLKQVYVNGELQEFNGTEFVLELSSDSGQKSYEIKAVDEAGNTKTIVVKIAAEWMKTGLVPSGKMVNLEAGNSYKLGSGQWTVGGDATSYNGNTTFYVKQDGSYVFTNQ